MRTLLFIGGPLVATIGFGFYSGLLDFAHRVPGIEHMAGVEQGGTFAIEHQETYQCDESGNNCVLVDEKTEVSEIDSLELEEIPIEYRNGSENIIVRKMNGIPKYTDIVVRRPRDFDWHNLKFSFEE